MVCLGVVKFAWQKFVGMDCEAVKSTDKLDRIEARSARIWMIYTFPLHLKGGSPELWRRIQPSAGYKPVRQLQGTLDNGNIYVLFKGSSSRQDRP